MISLKEAREQKNLSVEELATASNVTAETIRIDRSRLGEGLGRDGAQALASAWHANHRNHRAGTANDRCAWRWGRPAARSASRPPLAQVYGAGGVIAQASVFRSSPSSNVSSTIRIRIFARIIGLICRAQMIGIAPTWRAIRIRPTQLGDRLFQLLLDIVTGQFYGMIGGARRFSRTQDRCRAPRAPHARSRRSNRPGLPLPASDRSTDW